MTTKKPSEPSLPSSSVIKKGHPETAPEAASVPFTLRSQPAADRCREKGCIFPVRAPGERTCALHRLAEDEPKLFLSLQPSSFLLDQAKFGVPDPDFDYSRARDRRRLAVLRERTLGEVA